MVAAGAAGSGGGLLLDQPVVGKALAPGASRGRRLRGGRPFLGAGGRWGSLCPGFGERRAPVRLVAFHGDGPLRGGTRRIVCGDGTVPAGGPRRTLVGLAA